MSLFDRLTICIPPLFLEPPGDSAKALLLRRDPSMSPTVIVDTVWTPPMNSFRRSLRPLTLQAKLSWTLDTRKWVYYSRADERDHIHFVPQMSNDMIHGDMKILTLTTTEDKGPEVEFLRLNTILCNRRCDQWVEKYAKFQRTYENHSNKRSRPSRGLAQAVISERARTYEVSAPLLTA